MVFFSGNGRTCNAVPLRVSILIFDVQHGFGEDGYRVVEQAQDGTCGNHSIACCAAMLLQRSSMLHRFRSVCLRARFPEYIR